MLLRYHHLTRHPAVFRALTGLSVAAFDALAAEVLPRLAAAERDRLARAARRRAVGGGGGSACRRVTGCSWRWSGCGATRPTRCSAPCSASASRPRGGPSGGW